MRRVLILSAALLLGTAAAPSPSPAHEPQTKTPGFPPLPPKEQTRAHSMKGGDVSADRTMEKRVRGIETRWLGKTHAIEHAEGRRAADTISHGLAEQKDLGSGQFTQRLQPKNDWVSPSVGGSWAPGGDLPIVAINAIMLPTNKILYFAYPWRATEPDPITGDYFDNNTQAQLDQWNTSNAYLYDPSTKQSKEVPPPVNPETGKRVELFCAGQSLLADGRVLITGGNVGNPAGDPDRGLTNYGLDTTFVFDPFKAERGEDPWLTGPRMRQGRWYPTQLLMPDGRTVIVSGQSNKGDQDEYQVNRDVDVFYPDRGAGTLETLSDSRLDGSGQNGKPGPWRPDNVGQYPHMLWTPDGKILNYGPFKPDVWIMEPPLVGATSTRFSDRPDLPMHREWAGGFQIPPKTDSGEGSSKVMLVGGADRTDSGTAGPGKDPDFIGSEESTTIFDEANPDAGWQAGPTLTVARAFVNTILLPSGKVAAIGGGDGNWSDTRYYRWTYGGAGMATDGSQMPTAENDQRRVEILDPQSGADPVLGNAQAEGRTYHSTALLLPDGRVWSAGDDINGPMANPNPSWKLGPKFEVAQKLGAGSGVRTDTAEIWTPPYLLNDDGTLKDRPTISAPRNVPWGQPFEVSASSDVTRAELVSPGATTHAVDMSQRLVSLRPPSRTGSTLTFQGPRNGDIAPPGWYMLFAFNAAGTPSVASWVYVGNQPADITNPNPYIKPPKNPPGGGGDGGGGGGGGGGSTGPSQPGNNPPTKAADPIVEKPPPPGGKGKPPGATRFRLGVTLSLATSLRRLERAKRFGVRVRTNRPASVRVNVSLEVRRKVKGKRRTVLVPLTRPARARIARANTTRRVTVRLSRTALARLRSQRRATLRIVVTAKPTKGKAVRVTRRPVLR